MTINHKGYTIVSDYYAGFFAVMKNDQFMTLAGSSEGAKRWIDDQITYFNERTFYKIV